MQKVLAVIIFIALLISVSGCVSNPGDEHGVALSVDSTESKSDNNSVQDVGFSITEYTENDISSDTTVQTTVSAIKPTTQSTFDTTTKPASQSAISTTTKTTTSQPLDNTTTNPNELRQRLYPVTNYAAMKAVWVSQFDMQLVFSADLGTYTHRVQTIINNLKGYGFNTIIFQVRPYADSFYPSSVYPPSQFLTGKGVAYDAFKIFLDEAKKQAFSVHAWINPMRGPLETVLPSVDNKYKIKQWWDDPETRGKLIVKDTDNRVYLNPSYGEVRNLIAQGAAEIVEKYNVDGIHFDDYFDKACFKTGDMIDFDINEANYASFRRNVVSKLVKEIYGAVKTVNPNVPVGVSPAGIISNVINNDMADVTAWCSQKGYVDYICPQVYFGLEHQNYDFIKVCRQWSALITEPSITLYIGLTIGKAVSEYDAYAGTGKYEWRDNKDVIKRCLEYVKTMEKAKGISIFCYQYLFDPVSGEKNQSSLEEVNGFLPVMNRL